MAWLRHSLNTGQALQMVRAFLIEESVYAGRSSGEDDPKNTLFSEVRHSAMMCHSGIIEVTDRYRGTSSTSTTTWRRKNSSAVIFHRLPVEVDGCSISQILGLALFGVPAVTRIRRMLSLEPLGDVVLRGVTLAYRVLLPGI